MSRIKRNCRDKKLANELERRWRDFWEIVKRKFNQGADDLQAEIVEQHRQLRSLREQIHFSHDELIKMRREREGAEEALAKFKRSKAYRQFDGARTLNDLHRQLANARHLVCYYQRREAAERNGVDKLEKVQRKLIRENLGEIDRHLHRLALNGGGCGWLWIGPDEE